MLAHDRDHSARRPTRSAAADEKKKRVPAKAEQRCGKTSGRQHAPAPGPPARGRPRRGGGRRRSPFSVPRAPAMSAPNRDRKLRIHHRDVLRQHRRVSRGVAGFLLTVGNPPSATRKRFAASRRAGTARGGGAGQRDLVPKGGRPRKTATRARQTPRPPAALRPPRSAGRRRWTRRAARRRTGSHQGTRPGPAAAARQGAGSGADMIRAAKQHLGRPGGQRGEDHPGRQQRPDHSRGAPRTGPGRRRRPAARQRIGERYADVRHLGTQPGEPGPPARTRAVSVV